MGRSSSSVVEAALRFGLRGGVIVPPSAADARCSPSGGARPLRSAGVRLGPSFVPGRDPAADRHDRRLARCTARAEAAAAQSAGPEAEALRDQLGRRVDLLEAANRCARALGSSLELDEAFGAFIRELRGLVPFDRMAIVLAEGGVARVLATAGDGAERSSRRAATGRSQDRSRQVARAARRSTARTCATTRYPRGGRAAAARPALAAWSRRCSPARARSG